MTDKIAIMSLYSKNPSVKNGIDTLKIPNAPTFNNTPANNILPAVGASTCASGSQVCKGKRGTLTKNPNVNNRKSALDCWGVKFKLDKVT